jgi:MarR family transcriptional regulator, organic hydroperoxide resistance regulator
MSSNGGRAWQALLALLRSQKPHMTAIFAPLDLTPQLAHAVHAIADDGMTMRALATELACDASNATGIADRLERRGLIERTSDPADRRLKRLCLTAAGRRTRAAIEARLGEAPPPIAALSAADQQALREILERALAHAEAERLRSSA